MSPRSELLRLVAALRSQGGTAPASEDPRTRWSLPMQASAIKNEVALRVFMGPQRYSWHSPPRLNVTVEVGRPLHWHRITLLGRLTHSCSRGYQSWCPKTFHKHRRSNEHEVKNFAFTPGVVDEIGGLWMRSRMLASPWFTIQKHSCGTNRILHFSFCLRSCSSEIEGC